MKIIYRDCDPSLANDRSLPHTAYLVEYLQNGMTHFDIAIGNKRVEIFDYYWDNYREDLISMTQTEGRTNPKIWSPTKQNKKNK